MAKPSAPSSWMYLAGIACLLVGAQLRLFESFVVRPEVTRVVAGWHHQVEATASTTVRQILLDNTAPRKVVAPPNWVGWACLAGGVVLVAQGYMARGSGGGKKSGK